VYSPPPPPISLYGNADKDTKAGEGYLCKSNIMTQNANTYEITLFTRFRNWEFSLFKLTHLLVASDMLGELLLLKFLPSVSKSIDTLQLFD